jgi:hypothetical protein
VRCLILVAILLTAAWTPATARAQNRAALEEARVTYRAALALEAAGDWARALGKMREVARVKLTPQVRFHIARCQQHLGAWIEAVGDYRLAIAEAEAAGIEDVRREGLAALHELEPKIPTIFVRRGRGAEAAIITLDGMPLGEPSLAAGLRLDPGPHRVAASAGGRRFDDVFTLGAGQRRTITVVIDDPLVAVPPAEDGPSKVPAILAYSGGAAGLALAGVFWALRVATIDELDSRCLDGRCPPSAEPTAQRGQVFTALAAVGLGIGVLGAGAGTLLLLRSPRRATPAGGAARPVLELHASPSGLVASGAF